MMQTVAEGETVQYSIPIPSNHMPGTHWYHPHYHGTSSSQVASGAMGALIIEDHQRFHIPDVVRHAQDIVFLATYFDDEMITFLHHEDEAADKVFKLEGVQNNEDSIVGSDFVAVNGQLNPVISVQPNKWYRFRVLWTNWMAETLDLTIEGCDMMLLAKDGVYIRDFPRQISEAPIPSGGRADIMVRCPQRNEEYSVGGVKYGDEADPKRRTIARIDASGTPASSTELPEWVPDYPSYLTDLRHTSVSSGCNCETNFPQSDDDVEYSVNGLKFAKENILHHSYIGAVVEREIKAKDHPYHQHNFPFQLISGDLVDDDYYKEGDWHDSVDGNGLIRFSPSRYPGKMIVHCHVLLHEDKGMMSQEMVYKTEQDAKDAGGEACGCNFTSPKYEYCTDSDDLLDCYDWAQNGECDSNQEYMHENCKRSCDQC